MSRWVLIVTLGAAIFTGACGGTTASDGNVSLDPKAGAPAGAQAQPGPAASKATVAEAQPAAAKPAAIGPVYREVTIPTGTALTLKLTTAVASDTSHVEDPVSAELIDALTIDGRNVLPAGATVTGTVTNAEASGRVKGRAVVAFRFTSLRSGDDRYDVQTVPVSRLAPATTGEDAAKIGIGAGAGAVVGAILGGKKGAAEGAAVGGGAGTGVVLATKGLEVRLAPGADVTTQLTAPLTVRVRVS